MTTEDRADVFAVPPRRNARLSHPIITPHIRSAGPAAGRRWRIFLLLGFIGLVAAVWPTPAMSQSNGVLREVYTGFPDGSLSSLTNNAAFPASPTTESIEANFEAPADWTDFYGQRMRALLVPPVTGQYVFWIATDDQGALFLSTDEDPARKTRIAWVSGWSGSRVWNTETNQRSAAITLTNGRRYYIEALQSEGAGGDNLAVTWQMPGGAAPADGAAPISGAYLVPVGLTPPIISGQPTNTVVIEGGTATFTIRLQRFLGATFQWLRNGTNIPGATNSTYAFGPVALTDSGSTFRCFITNALGSTNSAAATLTILADTTRPTITGAASLGELTVASVFFSEPVEPASATNAVNYTLNGGSVTVLRAVFGPDARTILLTTTPMLPNSTNTLAVSNVRDRAATPNFILPGSTATFVITARPLDISYLKLAFEPPGPSSRRHGVVISEVMYHPTNRTDGRNLEFIEVYNSQPWFEEIGGWRISGAVDYLFPPNTFIQPRSYRIIAAQPTDFSAVRPGITGVLGPFEGTNNLPNDSGTLRLRNAQDAVLFEMTYRSEPPWPVSADGAGHSLVLARPSYGERDVRAWDASDIVGGTPAAQDTQSAHAQRSIVINEVLAHTDPPQVDYIELYNYSSSASVTLHGCALTDDPDTNKFVITNLVLAPRGFAVFTEEQLGFALSAAGETIYLKAANGSRIIDALRFGAQENGVAFGRFPDGAPRFTRLLMSTPGTNNAAFRPTDIVISEIMYDPISGDSSDEYVELFNRGTNAVGLGGWQLEDAVQFAIPNGTVLAPGGYVVIAKNVARVMTNHPNLTFANTLGGFSGVLANGGERLALSMPDRDITTNLLGQLVTNTAHIVVDEVTYRDGGRWGRWSSGGGSSLELRDAHADRRLAPNWAESDESAKSPWVNVEFTGAMDNGWADATQLHVTLLGAGEALLDNVEVIPSGSTNVVGNGTFEGGAADWISQGNHNATSWEPGEGYGSGRSLHLRATGRGDTGANRVRVQLGRTLASGTTVTLRARARWLKGNPCLLLRLRGNWLEAPGYLLAIKNLGTPGAPNSRTAPNIGPAITDVRHWPPLPPASTPVLVTAAVNDPDGVAFLALNYRIDPSANYLTVPMTNNGAGIYSAVIPAQAAGVGAAFFIEALDNHLLPAGRRFPDDAPARECMVRWGDTTQPGTLGTYRMWISQTNVTRWSTEEKMSNNPKDITFLYGTNRVIYNAGAIFHGSPYHSPSYNSPLGNSCDYDVYFPSDDRLLGEIDMNLFRPGNGGGDGTAQAEMHAYWFAAQFGLPFLYNRPVFVFANGQRREMVFLDAQQPNGDYVDQWFPDDANGDLHKIQIGFEFGDLAYGNGEPGYGGVGADLNRYTTTGGVKKQARYRQTWQRRSASIQELHDYTNIFNLVETVLTNAPIGSETYTRALTNAVDVEEWFKGDVAQHLYNNYDSYSYGGGQNAFAYKPERDTWKLFIWDNDFAFGGAATDTNVFNIGGAEHGPRNDHPPFARIYWQALIDAANGMMTAERSNPILDSRYNGMVAAGAAVASSQGIKDFIAARRTYLLSLIASNQGSFRITSNAGQDFSTNRNFVTLAGTAPLAARTILVNGIPLTATWTSLSNWTARLPLLAAGTNVLLFTAVDSLGKPVAGVSNTIRVSFTGAIDPPQRVVLNEIHYHPAVPDTSFLEIFNSSSATTFDVSGWRVEGVDGAMPAGTFLEPGQFLVMAADAFAFRSAFASVTNAVFEFSGKLDNGGETLRLIKSGAIPALDQLIDAVAYDDDPPWPGSADGGGLSLQLLDPLQDNARVSNWSDGSGWRYFSFSTTIGGSRLSLFFDAAGGDIYLDDLSLVPGNTPGVGVNSIVNGGFESPLIAPWIATGISTNSHVTNGLAHSGNGCLHLVQKAGAAALTSFYQDVNPAVVTNTTFTLSGWYLTGAGTNRAFTLRAGPAFQAKPDLRVGATPGASNIAAQAIPPYPSIWLNEVEPVNFAGATDNVGEHEPWIELFNAGTHAVSLAECYLSDNYADLATWAFPSNAVIDPGQFLVVWADGEPAESTPVAFHTNFRLTSGTGSAVLSRFVNGGMQILDYLNYSRLPANGSHGAVPDGQPFVRRPMYQPTPGTTNNPAPPDIPVFLNEWMADNTGAVADPADGQFEDWFEIYNAGDAAIDLGGFYLTDNLANPLQFRIPAGYVVPPRGYLLAWADNEVAQNDTNRADLHVNFKLDKAGEALGLFGSDGTPIDALTFGAQTADLATGRFPDGSPTIVRLTNFTPRAANFIPLANSPPAFVPTPDQFINGGRLLVFTASAVDTNLPSQTLTFSLGAGAPAGASIDPLTGQVRWRPGVVSFPATNALALKVTDDGSPSLSATTTVQVVVLPQPQLGNATVTGTSLTLSWETHPGRTYQVQSTDNLDSAAWVNVGSPITATDWHLILSDEIQPSGQRFYRVLQVD